jgi:hypothetical protein
MASIPSQFASWLAVAERDGRGGPSAQPPSIVRGYSRAFLMSLETHPTFDDWTDGEFVAEIKASPDAPDPVLASFTVDVGTPAGGFTPVTFTLLPENQTGLPEDTANTGVIELLFQINFVPTSGEPFPLVQTNIFVTGSL